MIERMVQLQEAIDVRFRLAGMVSSLRDIQERLHQFPILDLFYRSRQPSHDPEPMLYALAHGAMAARLVSIHEKRLRPEAEELTDAITDTMLLLSLQHMPRNEHRALTHPRVTEEDRRTLDRLLGRLDEQLQRRHDPGDESQQLLLLIARTRLFAAGLDRLTSWRIDQAAGEQSSAETG